MKKFIVNLIFFACTATISTGIFLAYMKSMHKYKVGDCLKGNAYYYQVYRSSGFFYDLQLINYPYYFTYKKQVVHKSFNKVACDEVPSDANTPIK